jgi:hypothetical protein
MPDELEPELPDGATSTGEQVSPKFTYVEGELQTLPAGWTFPKG